MILHSGRIGVVAFTALLILLLRPYLAAFIQRQTIPLELGVFLMLGGIFVVALFSPAFGNYGFWFILLIGGAVTVFENTSPEYGYTG